MIFAVRSSNIQQGPKVISLLSKMHVIVALSACETPIQCTQCGEWSHKKNNCAKCAQCFYYSSDKHSAESHYCQEEECLDKSQNCPHLPKFIVCNGPHSADYTDCPLKPSYSKAKDALIKVTLAKKPKLKILQVNVGQSGIANNLALQYIYQHVFDLLFIQETWIGSDFE